MIPTPTLSFSSLQTAVHQALRSWTDLENSPTNLLSELLLVRVERQKTLTDTPTNHRLATNQVLLNALERLKKQDGESAAILESRYLDNQTVLMVAAKMRLSEDQAKRRQRDAIRSLTQLILDQEKLLRETQIQIQTAQLPPPTYQTLIGLKPLQEEILNHLIKPETPWILTIAGIGGIGKTSLADAVSRASIHQFTFQQTIWLRAEQKDQSDSNWEWLNRQLFAHLNLANDTSGNNDSVLKQLQLTLKETPTLIVIDNLETTVNYAELVANLTKLANPSKFILTTRKRFPTSAQVRNFLLNELDKPAAIELIRCQAKTAGLDDLNRASEEMITPIYETVGGNPLAIKLIIGLAELLPLPEILSDLTQAKTTAVEELYRHIYLKAWQTISESSQQLLEQMPMAAGVGMKIEQMQAISGLSTTDLWAAITELVNLSLLEVRGSTWERRYGIHRLTESFLQTEIIGLEW